MYGFIGMIGQRFGRLVVTFACFEWKFGRSAMGQASAIAGKLKRTFAA